MEIQINPFFYKIDNFTQSLDTEALVLEIVPPSETRIQVVQPMFEEAETQQRSFFQNLFDRRIEIFLQNLEIFLFPPENQRRNSFNLSRFFLP